MTNNWSMSRDDLYGPPPAYSLDPPTSIYTIPQIRNEYQERPPPLPPPCTSIDLSTKFLRYILANGLLHILIGLTSIVCGILLFGMNESYPFTGIWAGVLCIILGIYLIIFISHSEKQISSLKRFKLIHIIACLLIIIALVLSSINLASNSCYEKYFELDQCQYSAQKLKIVLVTFFAFTFLQICITSISIMAEDVRSYIIETILSFQTLCTCITTTIGQYIYAYYLETYPIPSNSTSNYTTINYFSLTKFKDYNNKCIEGDTSSTKDAQAWAQERSADLFFWTNLYSSCPIIIMTYILSLYIPTLGKRFVLILPMIGGFAQFVIWLTIIYFYLPEYWWYIAAIINGLSGSSSVLSFILTLIITDNTIDSDLSSRFVRLGAIQTGLSSIATLAIGYYIEWRGFTDLYWMGLGFELLSIFIGIFIFKSSNSTNINERTPLLTSINENEFNEFSSNSCSQFFQICTVFRCNRRTQKKSTSLFLTLFSNIFYTLASSTFAPFLWFLLNAPFCMTSRDIGNYSALAAISYAILSLLGMQALTNIGASDAIICLISHIFFFGSTLWLAFANYSWELYAGLLLSAFSGYQGSLTLSMMSKWLEPHERSHAFAFVTEINTMITLFGTSLFNWVYARTVVNNRNLTLFIGAGLCIIPSILNLWLFLVTRKMSEEDLRPLSETETEPAPIRLRNNGLPPHAGDAACIIIPSRSLTTSLRTPVLDRSRSNSVDSDEIEQIPDTVTNDLIII
ncbi:unnamed protein product [Adineta steineri]|uniref:Uncharacterized protein n=1 Tax=Adineta steineri TaxID=433720 RepID=A0A813NPX0_9BILA|nr:unnamed protein product [Adineta steineri]